MRISDHTAEAQAGGAADETRRGGGALLPSPSPREGTGTCAAAPTGRRRPGPACRCRRSPRRKRRPPAPAARRSGQGAGSGPGKDRVSLLHAAPPQARGGTQQQSPPRIGSPRALSALCASRSVLGRCAAPGRAGRSAPRCPWCRSPCRAAPSAAGSRARGTPMGGQRRRTTGGAR